MTVNVRKAQPLPDLNDPVIDRRRRFTPTWYRWIKPLLNSTVDLKVNLEATDAQVTNNTAAITTEASVRASADSALATQITTLTATVDANDLAISAALTQEQSVRASADTALATQITTLTATVNNNATASSAALTQEQTARASEDAALAASITSLTATVNNNATASTSALTQESSARATTDAALASQITSLTATVDNNATASAAALSQESSARATQDDALSSSITSLTAKVNTNAATSAAAISAEQTARANGDSALSSSITSLTTTVNGNTNSITSLSQSIDGVRAQWGVAITQNGAVSGLIRLDGGNAQSTFTVVADRFVVVNPNTSADAISNLFQIGKINEVDGKVGLNGTFIIDNTILARHLDVLTLSAITANIGTVTAGKLQSADGKMVIDLDAKTIRITT